MSDVSVCNEALLLLGDKTISSLSDTSTEGKICNAMYDSCRQDLLRKHPWNFAIERVSLAALGAAPEFRYDYQYQAPSDCLRLLTVHDTTNWFS